MIIGLAGYARSGKDEAAKALTVLGYHRRAFADKMREMLLALNPIVGCDEDNDYWFASDVIAVYGWDGYKASPYGNEMRRLMQRLGTEAGRDLISDSFWVDLTLPTHYRPESDGKIVVTDVRFPNEAEAIVKRGGKVIRITRPGVVAPNGHVSEHALQGWDYDAVISNDKSINFLHDRIRRVVSLFDS